MRRSVNRLKTRNIGNVIRQPAPGEMSAVFPRRGKGGKHWVMGGRANVSSRPNDSAGLGSGKGRDGVRLGGESEWLGTNRTRLMAYLSGDVGSAGVGKIRTCWDLSLTLGIPFSQWGAQPFIVHAFPFPTGILQDLAPTTEGRDRVQQPTSFSFALPSRARA
jgi:hypothetical protein